MPSSTTALDARATTERSSPPRACLRNPVHGSEGWSRAGSTAAKSRPSPLPVRASGLRPRAPRHRSVFPAPPAKPSVTPLNGAIEVAIKPATGVEEISLRMLGRTVAPPREESHAITSASTDRTDPRPRKREGLRLPGVRDERYRRQRRLRAIQCRAAVQRPARAATRPPCRSSPAPSACSALASSSPSSGSTASDPRATSWRCWTGPTAQTSGSARASGSKWSARRGPGRSARSSPSGKKGRLPRHDASRRVLSG